MRSARKEQAKLLVKLIRETDRVKWLQTVERLYLEKYKNRSDERELFNHTIYFRGFGFNYIH